MPSPRLLAELLGTLLRRCAIVLGQLLTRLHTIALLYQQTMQFFGSVRVTWQNEVVTNLYSSVVTISNPTIHDFSDLKIKVYTADCRFLTESTIIEGTSFVLKWTDEYSQSLRTLSNEQPSDHQRWLYSQNREYLVPVFNRGQRIVIRLLTTSTNGIQQPSVWIDTQHKGIRVQFIPITQQIHGVPVRIALPIGLVAAIATLVLSSIFISEVWIAALLCLVVGLIAQSVGALIYRVTHYLKTILFS